MKKKMWLLAMVGVVLLSAGTAWAQGDFYVIAGSRGVGTPITSLPYTISSPGFYYLTGNLTYLGGSNGINVNTNDVTIDLMGFSLSGVGGTVIGINASNQKNVEVRNGSLYGWSYGVAGDGTGYRNQAINLRVEECTYGIDFYGSGGANLVQGCSVEAVTNGISINGGVASGNTVTNCDNIGIHGIGTISGNNVTNCPNEGIAGSGTIRDNSVTNCRYGIYCTAASSIIGNTVVTSSGQYGIYIITTDPNLVTQSTVSGPGTHFSPGSGTVNVANTNAGF